jgi:hypothetical protein
MKNIWYWIIGIGTILILCLVTLLGVGFLRLQGMPMDWMNGGSNVWGFGNWHHHGFRWGGPMMGMGGGLLLLLVVLFGFMVLVAVGVFFLVRALQQPNRDRFEATTRHCDHCGKAVSPDWQVCPYCGESLRD